MSCKNFREDKIIYKLTLRRTEQFKFELLSMTEKQSGNSLKNPITSNYPIRKNLKKSTKDFSNYKPGHLKN